MRGSQQLLSIQYVDLRSHPHLLPGFSRIDLALAGNHSLLERLDLGNAIRDIQILLAHLEYTVTSRIIQVLKCPFLVGQRLAHARLSRKPLEDRNIELHPDFL